MIDFEGTKGDEGAGKRAEAYNDDSDDEGGPRMPGHGVGCSQQ